MDLSVVVLSWNTRDLLLACLDGLERALADCPGVSHEIVVVDNGSRDGSVEALRARVPRLELLALPENRGFAGGCNAALERVRGRVVLLLNSDVRIGVAALERCLADFDALPRAGIVSPQLERPDGRLQRTAHPLPGLVTELVPRPLLELVAPQRAPSRRIPPSGPLEVEALLGAALFVRRAAIEEVGPLDPGYFFFLEETDWCWRMRRAGWQVILEPRVHALHESGASSKRVLPSITRIEYHRSLYRFLGLRRGKATRWLVILVRSARAAGTACLLLLAAPFDRRSRGRLRERLSLLGWHLRGLPAQPTLAHVGRTGPVSPAATSR